MNADRAGDEESDAADDGGSDEYTFDDVSVVMGTYNEEAAIATVLDDIERVTDGRAEVVCVDGSSDRSHRGTASRSERRC